MLTLLLLACSGQTIQGPAAPSSPTAHLEPTRTLEGPVSAFAPTQTGALVALGRTITRIIDSDSVIPVDELPPGSVVFLGEHGDTVFAHVNGKGLFRTTPTGWTPSSEGLSNPLLGLAGNRAFPTPLSMTSDDDGRAWLATVGGLFYSDDTGSTWSLAGTTASGSVAILFTDIAASDDTVVATAQLPSGIMPAAFDGTLSGTVFRSSDGGDTWEDISSGLPSDHATSATFGEDGSLYIGTMDRGSFVRSDDTWTPLGGPSDVVDLAWGPAGLQVASASRGLWAHDGSSWTATLTEHAAAGVAPSGGVTWGGQVVETLPGRGDPAPESKAGTVHIALSHHVNYYHSYRGDSPDDDGFGQDIDVMRRTLTWLENHPEVRADWDSDNAWTTDLWMPQHAPDVLAHIAERVADGRDDVRLMSWNNASMAASSLAEFTEAVERGRTSNTLAFGEMVPGVQPQECMFGPDHLSWYPSLGIDWVTLFYAANGFTALRQDVDLEGIEAFSPFDLTDPASDASMVAVPVWHHADVLDHGGLAGWAQQLHDRYAEDTLLVIHFDADAETWENFDREIVAARALPFVEWTTIDRYLQSHEPRGAHPLPGDVADGTGDGFQSWAEKNWNQELFAIVQHARQLDAVATLLAPEDEAVAELLQSALESRLLALSTTNYGLAAPTLHPDRIESGSAQAHAALDTSTEAASRAAALVAAPGEVLVVNPRASSGSTLLHHRQPAALWPDTDDPLGLAGPSGDIIPLETRFYVEDDREMVEIEAVVDASPQGVSSWSVVVAPEVSEGSLTEADAPAPVALQAPFVECADGTRVATLLSSEVLLAPHRRWVTTEETWSVDVCGQPGAITRELTRWEGLEGVVVEVVASLGTSGPDDDLFSVVLAPLACDGEVDTLTWRTMGGAIRERPARRDVETWNGLAADGYAVATCDGGATVAVSHDVNVRSSMAFMPIRNEGGSGLLAPLGTLWGDGPHHESRRTGGLGTGDWVVPIVGSQFRPAGPDWAGATVELRLLVHDAVDHDQLDLFAHPPELIVVD